MNDFYSNKNISSVEWWLDECAFPGQCWARLRIFDDGSSDILFDVKNEDKCYGFKNRESAVHFLLEDEFISLNNIDAEDEKEHNINKNNLKEPDWFPEKSTDFKYVGEY
jgi:hypothetical protein